MTDAASTRVAVIGGGPAGCTAAYKLARAGRRVSLFESADAVGGRTTSWRMHGTVVDSGAGFFTNFYPQLHALLHELNLQDQIIPISRAIALSNADGVATFTLGSTLSFLRLPSLGPLDKLRMALATATLTWRCRSADLARPETLVEWDDASITDDALQRFGTQAYEYLVRPGVEPFWYYSCEEASRSLSMALTAKAANAKLYTLRDGMDTYCRGLATQLRNLGATINTGTAVQSIRRDGSRFIVQTDQATQTFDRIVIATPANVAQHLTRDLGDHLVNPTMRELLIRQRYASNIHAAWVVPREQCVPGVGGLFPNGPGEHAVAAITFETSKLQTRGELAPDEEVVGTYLSSAESQSMVQLDDDAVYARAWQLTQQLCPSLQQPLRRFALARRSQAIAIPAPGHYRRATQAIRQQTGPLAFAGDHLATSTVEGALVSGLRAAEQLLKD